MRLLMTLVVRNEQDILADNLEYHLAQGVDHVLVTDHGSTDATPEILAEYARNGVATVLRDEERGHHQSRRVTRMARMTVRQQPADWVIHNDADEFWWPFAGSLRDVFAAIPARYGQIVVGRYNFLPVAGSAPPFWERLVHREPRSRNGIGLPLEPKIAHRPHANAVIAPGNHSLSGVPLRPVPLRGLFEIFHFPMRTFEQWEKKVAQTGVGYELVEDRGPGVGRDQLALLAALREHRLGDEWRDVLLDSKTIERRVAGGELVHDARLAEFMRRRPPSAQRPERGALRELIESALRAPAEARSLPPEIAPEPRVHAPSPEGSGHGHDGSLPGLVPTGSPHVPAPRSRVFRPRHRR